MMQTQQKLLGLSKERMGRFGEQICENVLRSSGMTYIPLCRIEMGGAPVATTGRVRTVLPDFDVAGDGVTAYVDAKVKTQSIRYRNSGEVRHGINKRNWEQYEEMGAIQKKQCGLLLVELLDDVGHWSGTIMAESFLSLGKPTPGFSNQSHMVYWPRKRFAMLGGYNPDELVAIAKGELAVNMKAVLQTSFSAPPRICPSHNDPALWIDEPERDSRGWIRTVCRICNCFVGSRPPECSVQKSEISA